MDSTLPDWAHAHGEVTAVARIRSTPEDFRVDEVLAFEADGDGPHVLLKVEKRGANTHWVAERLARLAGISPRDVGYAGMKDRHAVTVQHFTLPRQPGSEPDWMSLSGEGFHVLEAVPHRRKLKTGALRGNRFRLRLRNLTRPADELTPRLEAIRARGVPNYFGEQRFGREAGNLARAEHMLAGAGVRNRKLRGLLLSTARSVIFNDLLSRRVHDGSWDRLVPGDVLMLDGSHSVFCAEALDDALSARIVTGDLHPTGPLWGEGDSLCRGEACRLEERVAAEHPVLAAGLVAARVQSARRALRLPVRELEWTSPDLATLELSFFLPAGAYATAVLRELVRGEREVEENDA